MGATVTVPPAGCGAATGVPRELVHRAGLGLVLPVGWRRHSDTLCEVTVRWPGQHAFYAPVDGRHDPLLAAESIRQAGTLLAHARFDVPLGHQFILHTLTYDLDADALPDAVGPIDVRVDLECHDVRYRARHVAGMRYVVRFSVGGRALGVGSAQFDCVSGAVYRRLRGERFGVAASGELAPPLDPALVGRSADRDVVLAPGRAPGVWTLRVDPDNPDLFDHACDHVPGMALCEAARQVASVDAGTRFLPTGMDVAFRRYVEHDVRCELRIDERLVRDGRQRLRVVATQSGLPVFECVLASAV